MSAPPTVQVAVPSPLRRVFDYQWVGTRAPQPGIRVRIPFGPRETIGVVVGAEPSDLDATRLRPVAEALDETALLSEEILALARWAARYYHHSLGEVIATALPNALRQGEPARPRTATAWRLTEAGRAARVDDLASNATRQRRLLELLQSAADPVPSPRLNAELSGWQPAARALAERGWCETVEHDYLAVLQGRGGDRPPPLSDEQTAAYEALREQRDGFVPYLLEGVTGSGKTEVYLHAIADALAADRQALVLVPEIGLTPQLVERFARRFRTPIAVLHSGLSDRERLDAWLAARDGSAGIVLGTRSAVFTPLARPGLIIVDEEHDPSLKQQDGFRYHGRDLALVRGRRLEVPVVLGSATPALETLHNAQQGRYRHLKLSRRAGGARPPQIRLLDIRGRPLYGGLSEMLITEIRRHLDADGQVLLFLNRRGYAPTLMCHACGWVAECPRCDARLTLHRRSARVRCHHCGYERRPPDGCDGCASTELVPIGHGTERLEQTLAARFADHELVRIDRDSTRRKGALADLLERARDGSARLLLGTQMLAKGHHLPDVTLAAVIDADQGLFGADFRAPERMAQMIVQVAGRAGREARAGEVVVQTHHPEHPLLQLLLEHGYTRFAREDLEQRRAVGLPPFSALALLRAEAVSAAPPQAFLAQARGLAMDKAVAGVELLGPLPAPMERRAGRFRAQLLLRAARRADLHRLLDAWINEVAALREARRVRWSLDVDPIDTL